MVTISICWTSHRLGMLDVLFHSLSRQTFDLAKVQVILCDEWYEHRKDYLMTGLAGVDRLPGSIIHLPPKQEYATISDFVGYNTALAAAEGELVMFLTDSIWLHSECLLMHEKNYEFTGTCMVGFLDRYFYPPLRPSHDGHNSDWSVFLDEFTPRVAKRFFAENEPFYRERRGVADDYRGPMDTEQWYAALNETVPLASLKEVNGFDEIFTGNYGVGDIDLACRLKAIGCQFIVNPESISQKLGDHAHSGVIPHKQKIPTRGVTDSFTAYKQRKTAIEAGEMSPRALRGVWNDAPPLVNAASN